MAKLSAHGKELLRLEYPMSRKAYMSDGTILQCFDGDWTIAAKVKPGVDPQEYAETIRKRYWARPQEFRHYIDMLSRACSIKTRWRLHTAISLMPEDADGVWSTVTDDWQCDFDLDEIVALCRAYQQAEAAMKAVKVGMGS